MEKTIKLQYTGLFLVTDKGICPFQKEKNGNHEGNKIEKKVQVTQYM